MGHYAVKQPNGMLAVFSTVVDGFVAVNCTVESLVCAGHSRGKLDLVLEGKHEEAYGGFGYSLAEAMAWNRLGGNGWDLETIRAVNQLFRDNPDSGRDYMDEAMVAEISRLKKLTDEEISKEFEDSLKKL